MLRSFQWLTALVLTLLLAGCVISPRRPDPNAVTNPAPTPTPTPTPTPPPPTPVGKLYVSNTASASIVRFDDALAATTTGNIAPAATIKGAATLLDTPQYILLDTAADRLYVADPGNPTTGNPAILVFESVSTKTGNVPPNRVIAGAATVLTQPVDLSLDKGRDLLYVIDGQDVQVFSSASTSSGNVAPARTLAAGFNIGAILVDAANDRLFLADLGGNAINIYDGASALPTGVITATRSLSGPTTGLQRPSGIRIDSNGRLVVSNFNAPISITMYTGAATVAGDTAPAATISGANTAFTGLSQITLRSVGATTDELYVADVSGKALIFANLSGATGNIAPTRNISGANTGLGSGSPAAGAQTVHGVAIDPTH